MRASIPCCHTIRTLLIPPAGFYEKAEHEWAIHHYNKPQQTLGSPLGERPIEDIQP
ncbi:MAG: hypothetical protein ACI9JM_000355 [Halioglobus sp.]|jgi:hypothetical protein